MKRKFDHSDSEDGDSDAPEEVGRQHGSKWQRQQQQQPSSSQEHGDSDEASGSEEEDEGESSEDLEQQEQAIEQQLADIPFEVLEKLSRDGKGPTPAAARAAALEAKHKVFHRETKNRPQEVSSKRPVSRFREVIQVPKQPSKDPRFDQTIGGKSFSNEAYSRRYAFLYDEVLPQERAALKQQLKKEKSEGKRRELQAQMTRLQQQLNDESVRRKSKQLEQEWKSTEKAAVAAGKSPFFLSKAAKKKRELLAKYEELKAGGRLDKFMEKRRKKNAAKDHRYLPSGRRAGGMDQGKAPKAKRELLAKYDELKAGGRLDKFMEKRRKKNAAKDPRYLPSGRRPGGPRME
ncbi:hypothetical protein OEZ86_004852 [Tetradesmus obliquus]|nr:hypothetical protein OEZ86_004852 [Tetradesmus obliquus]